MNNQFDPKYYKFFRESRDAFGSSEPMRKFRFGPEEHHGRFDGYWVLFIIIMAIIYLAV